MASVVHPADALSTRLASYYLFDRSVSQAGGSEPLASAADAELRAQLERVLAAALSGARAAWPRIALADEDFVRCLARHTPADRRHLVVALPTQHVADLYLACACAQGVPAALAELERLYIRKTAAYLTRLRPTPQLIDETQQALRARLLVPAQEADGSSGERRIAQYSGRGALESWMCAAAIRCALTLLKRDRRQGFAAERIEPHAAEPPIDLLLPTSPHNQELALLKTRYAADFAACLRTATAALSPRNRNLLRMHHVQKLTMIQMARAFATHRTTISRWLDEAHYAILHGTRQTLSARLQLSEEECESLLGLVRSRLELSLPSLLATPAEAPRIKARPRS
jgi:RNA polymerase sigma-70 factor (ECF subfamily)